MHFVALQPAVRFSASTPLTTPIASISTRIAAIPARFDANSAESRSYPAASASNAAETDLTSNQSTSPITDANASNPAEIDANTARSQLTDSKSLQLSVNLVNPSKSLKTSQREISRGGPNFSVSPNLRASKVTSFPNRLRPESRCAKHLPPRDARCTFQAVQSTRRSPP